jgi:hypothetical protein
MKVILDIVLNHTGNFGEANLCKLFDRNWKGDQSNIDACMIPFTQKDGGRLAVCPTTTLISLQVNNTALVCAR